MDFLDKIIALFNKIMEKIKQETETRQARLHLVRSKEVVRKSAQFYKVSLSEEFVYDEIIRHIEGSMDDTLDSCVHWVEDLLSRGLIREDIARDLHRQVSSRRRRLLLEKRPTPLLPHVLKREEHAKKRREIREIKVPPRII